MARRQAYEFTQYLLPEEAWLAPAAVWEILRGPDATTWLAALWQQARQYANTAEAPIEPVGLVAEQCLVGTHEAVLISLPAPVQAPEAWYALLVRTSAGAAPFRYFMLETTPDFRAAGEAAEGPGPTMVGERQADADVHRLHGAGPPAPTPVSAARFIGVVAQILTADSVG